MKYSVRVWHTVGAPQMQYLIAYSQQKGQAVLQSSERQSASEQKWAPSCFHLACHLSPKSRLSPVLNRRLRPCPFPAPRSVEKKDRGKGDHNLEYFWSSGRGPGRSPGAVQSWFHFVLQATVGSGRHRCSSHFKGEDIEAWAQLLDLSHSKSRSGMCVVPGPPRCWPGRDVN